MRIRSLLLLTGTLLATTLCQSILDEAACVENTLKSNSHLQTEIQELEAVKKTMLESIQSVKSSGHSSDVGAKQRDQLGDGGGISESNRRRGTCPGHVKKVLLLLTSLLWKPVASSLTDAGFYFICRQRA